MSFGPQPKAYPVAAFGALSLIQSMRRSYTSVLIFLGVRRLDAVLPATLSFFPGRGHARRKKLHEKTSLTSQPPPATDPSQTPPAPHKPPQSTSSPRIAALPRPAQYGSATNSSPR